MLVRIFRIIVFSVALSACTHSELIVGAISARQTSISAPSFEVSATPMPLESVNAETPPGYLGFCLREPDQCSLPEGSPLWVIATPAVMRKLAQVNNEVNSSIWPEDDMRHYGKAEHWALPTDGYGDCEDYALMKRKKLLDSEFPPAALRLAIVLTPDKTRHAVLTVVTDKGDYVLDNMRDAIVSWDQSGYFWIERQNPAVALAWVSLRSANFSHISVAEAATSDWGR